MKNPNWSACISDRTFLEEDAENFAQEVEELYPDVDVDVHMGGQPIYYYVLSVE